jgi:two-component system cell cycle response regulator
VAPVACSGETNAIAINFERPGSACDRVLVADDDAMFRRILQTWLEGWGYQVTVADNGSKAWSILQKEPPVQILLLDWIMPDVTGVDICRRVREQNRAPYQYVLLATANDAKQDLVRGMEAGADDYLTKPFDKRELQARLRAANRILTLQNDSIQAREQLLFQATHDSLTGLWNRHAILETLNRELQRAARSGETMGVLLIDVDHFKMINDTHGHLIGDDVLREVTQRINDGVRVYDSVGRYGGEELLVVLPDCSRDWIQEGAERIRSAIDRTPMLFNGAEFSVTVSIGATVATGKVMTDNEVLAAADIELYRAKRSGRNRTALSDRVLS